MKLQIKVDEEGNIVDSCFKTFGCGSAIASSSVATEWVKGKSLDDVLTIKNSDIAKHLSLPPVKLHCSMLAGVSGREGGETGAAGCDSTVWGCAQQHAQHAAEQLCSP